MFGFCSPTLAAAAASTGLTQWAATEVEFCPVILSVLRLRLEKHCVSTAEVQEQLVWQKPSVLLRVSTGARRRACLLRFYSVSQSKSYG